jgi:hypothetical protein
MDDVEVIQAAVCDRDGTVRFAERGLSMLRHVVDGEDPDAITVAATTLKSLLDHVAPGETVDLLKIDAEGAEWLILTQAMPKIRNAVIEVHEPTLDGRRPDELLEEIAQREGFLIRRGRWPNIRWLLRNV